jgi:HD-GYP domain-containing protein (c-di-GMP phosphodiesterase class II)
MQDLRQNSAATAAEQTESVRIPQLLLAYQGSLAAVAVVLFVLATHYGLSDVWAVAGLAAVGAVAERGRVRLANDAEASISLLPTVFAAAVLGPLAGLLVAAASFAGEFPSVLPRSRRAQGYASHEQYLKWGIYTCVRAVYGCVAGFAALLAPTLVANHTARLAVATVIAAVVAEALDIAFAALTLRIRGGDWWAFVRMFVPIVLAALSLYCPIVALLSAVYVDVSPWTLALFFLPALAAQRLFALYQDQRRLTEELVGANAALERANLSFASALVATLDARDRYTAGHSAAVAIYAHDIAKRMGLTVEQQQLAHVAGLVHDIGKIGLPPGLLEKPGALTLEERREMQLHSEIGERILANVATYAEIAAVVRHHHERVDGGGYPDGLAGDEIPLLSRIIAVADAYNAMTSDRPYRDAMPSQVARLRLAQAVETQFDTSVVAAFEAILAASEETYRMARSEQFGWSEGGSGGAPETFVPVLVAAR